ncbi:zinc finger Ran-binding domain-containing protein 2 [Drosophila mojavensis]|uniref:Zinc finger Ran-binding domain-containing protein 2 n=1 Tax=Drosophila mojavensis TaxID=7230 RepID=B4KTE8_DROMO|nr:zinc finger Ran-binding domain-containing protein 2 [Drosophila mojavensis]EDW08509.1 uncharacterized protein Dmoj_GI20006 [Drosophila mojavensis]
MSILGSGGGGSGSSGGGSGISVSAGDWICPDIDCRHLNFARRLQCNKCNRERENINNEKLDRDRDRDRGNGSSGSSSSSSKKKLGTEIGKVAADKSRGLFSAEDWQCSKCANVNWARRQTCNMCNAPKFTDVEERTGFGGGYNDRGVVEYKEREDSDSEYDEFGRRKKRKNNDRGGDEDSRNRGRDEPKRARRSDIEGDEDEEEDDEDDDGDLSKYDLWGDNEVSSSNVKSKETDNGTSNNSSSAKEKLMPGTTATSKRASRASTSSISSSSSTSSSSSSDSSSTSSSSSSSSSNASNSKRDRKRSDGRSR